MKIGLDLLMNTPNQHTYAATNFAQDLVPWEIDNEIDKNPKMLRTDGMVKPLEETGQLQWNSEREKEAREYIVIIEKK